MNLENHYKRTKKFGKILSVVLISAMFMAFTACGKTETAEVKDSKENGSAALKSAKSSSVLVICFSATGNTKQMAEEIAGQLGADYFEIIPKTPYSDADLNYNDDNCRANKEQNDDTARPEIENAIENLQNYDTVLIGHPIWWGKEPRIIDTLMETYDFSGKNIAHFCTSGSSGIGASDKNLQAYLPDSAWLGSRRFSDKSEVTEWLSELGLK